jgi:hypothetical protein
MSTHKMVQQVITQCDLHVTMGYDMAVAMSSIDSDRLSAAKLQNWPSPK